MQCQKCGHKNDKDAVYCEKCGSSLLTEKSGMNNLTKTLIVLCIVLLAALSISAAYILTANNTAQTTPTITNNTTTNTTPENSTLSSSQNKTVSKKNTSTEPKGEGEYYCYKCHSYSIYMMDDAGNGLTRFYCYNCGVYVGDYDKIYGEG